MFTKKNVPLMLAIAIPIVMIAAVALAIYIPGIGKAPKYDFIYGSYGTVNYSNKSYSIEGIHLRENNIPTTTPQGIPMSYSGVTDLYIYHVATNSASQITYDEAKILNLDPGPTSPDGYEIAFGNNGGDGLLFGGVRGDYNNRYLKGHNRSTKLNLKLSGDNSYNNFEFLGWIIH